MPHKWFCLGRVLAYITLVIIVASCDGPPHKSDTPRNQTVISPQECLSAEVNFPCFYRRERSPKKNEKLVIFVHGVFSNPSNTWGDVRRGGTWPELVGGDDDFREFDIYLINYHTTYFTSAQMIHEIATRQVDALKDQKEFEQYKEIYFIAHSMGGLVVKSLLTHLNHGDDVAVLRRIKAVVYLGTPSQGADLSVLASLFSFNPQLRDLEPIHLNAWLSDLEKYWKQLMDDRKESLYPRAYCAYETINYGYIGRAIVPQGAAASECDGLPMGLPFNHSDLAVPTAIHRDPYQWVMNKIRKTNSAVQKPMPRSAGDQVSETEALLGEVRDPAYRQLVASVIHAFEPKAYLAVNALVNTPDGTRKIDVEVRSPDKSTVTVIDIVDLPIGRKAGVEVVDAALSKMADIKADAGLVCSNTGFDAIAIKKAKRMKIGLISVLRRGDQRVKAVIEELIYLRRIDLNPMTIDYIGDKDKPPNMTFGDLKYRGESIDNWLISRAMQAAFFYPALESLVQDSLRLKETTEFDLGQQRIKLRGFAIRFQPHVKWFSQTVQIDATTGIYDYLHGKVLLPREGVNAYVVQGINFKTATPLSSAPDMSDFWGGRISGEVTMKLALFENVPHSLRDYFAKPSAIDALVLPEDLPLFKDGTKDIRSNSAPSLSPPQP